MEPIIREPVVAFRTRRHGNSPDQLIVLSFAAAILAGTVILGLPISHAPGTDIGWLEALFTASAWGVRDGDVIAAVTGPATLTLLAVGVTGFLERETQAK